jgi:acyl carrier protein
MKLAKGDLIDYLQKELGVDTSTIDESTLLFSTGIIDSFALVDLINFIEGRCGFRVNSMDVTLDNLDSIARILAYVDGAASGT